MMKALEQIEHKCGINKPAICIFHFDHNNAVLLEAVVITDDVRMLQHG